MCLFFTGVFDNVSVVIRLTLEQTITPDHLRGRVSAINYVFIGFSNEFGAFESGATAALFGPTLSVVGGGLATLFVVAIVAATWPQLARLGPLHSLAPPDDRQSALSGRSIYERGVDARNRRPGYVGVTGFCSGSLPRSRWKNRAARRRCCRSSKSE